MKTQQNISLSALTSFQTGGIAQRLVTIDTSSEIQGVLDSQDDISWILGYGANSLISDQGLSGTTLLMRNSGISIEKNVIIADAGAWWDDVVLAAVDNNLWGIELMTGIPGSVGAAVVGNIAAYGQSVSQTLQWIEVFDISKKPHQLVRINTQDLGFDYRYSTFQDPDKACLVIVRAAFALSAVQQKKLAYFGALKVATATNADLTNLQDCRTVIYKTRKSIGAIWQQGARHEKTAGSFFRNPMVTKEQAEYISSFEEREVTRKKILEQNKIHGGDELRVSAALVLLAAGFKRGQDWGSVRLHPDHVLKIENIDNATSQEIYDVASEIVSVVKSKLSIDLVPEVRFLGTFTS